MKIDIIDDDVLSPTYLCGKRGEAIDVQVHGVTYSTWKLLDDLERHIGKHPKIACKLCYGMKASHSIDRLIETLSAMTDSTAKAAINIARLSESINMEKETND